MCAVLKNYFTINFKDLRAKLIIARCHMPEPFPWKIMKL